MKINFCVYLQIVYKDNTKIDQSYTLEWDPEKNDFDTFMINLMETIAIGEEEGTLDKINILSIDIIKDNGLKEVSQIIEFKKANKIS